MINAFSRRGVGSGHAIFIFHGSQRVGIGDDGWRSPVQRICRVRLGSEGSAPLPARETFERSKLNWSELSEPAHAEFLDWHKKLIQLRRTEKDLSDGEMKNIRVEFDEKNRWLAIERGSISVVCNLANNSWRIPLRSGEYRTLLASEPAVIAAGGSVILQPESVVIFKLK